MPDFLSRHWGEIAKRERMKMRLRFTLLFVPISLDKNLSALSSGGADATVIGVR